jgi:hypothetical protein
MPTNPNTTVVSAKYAVRIAESYRGRIIMLPFAPSHRAAGLSHAAQNSSPIAFRITASSNSTTYLIEVRLNDNGAAVQRSNRIQHFSI